MKMQLRNNRIALLLLFFSFTSSIHAQSIIEWVGDQVKGYIDRKINEVTNYNRSTLGSWGSALWDGVVSAKTESDLKEKMSELENFPTSTTGLDGVEGKYKLTGDQSDYRKVYWNQSDYTKSILYSKHDIVLRDLGNGDVGRTGKNFRDSIYTSTSFKNLNEILQQEVLDSLIPFATVNKEIEETLLRDINENKRIANILNNHPEVLRVYFNSMSMPALRTSPSHLLYWGYTADSHKTILGKKAKNLLNPRMFTFCSGTNGIEVKQGNRTIAVINNNVILCYDLNLLNLFNAPNMRYQYSCISFSTDNFGRIIEFKHKLTNPGKCQEKSKLKPKEFAVIKGNEKVNKVHVLGFEKYGAPSVLANSFFVEGNETNDNGIKLLKKIEKIYSKSKNYDSEVQYILEYTNGCVIPSVININFLEQKVVLKN